MIQYRNAATEDIDILVDTRLQYLNARTDSGNFIEIYQNTYDYFKRTLANHTCEAILAFDDGKVVGTGLIYYYETAPCLYNMNGRSANITNLFVTAKYRRLGIGGTIIKQLVQSALSKNVKSIYVNSTDLGENLLKENGFAKVANDMIYMG